MEAGTRNTMTVEDWSALQARLVWAYDGPVAAANRRSPTTGRHLAAWFMRRGEVRVGLRGRTWRAGEGDWMLVGAQRAQQEFSEDARILSVNFRLEWPTGEGLLATPIVVPAERATELGRAGEALVKFVRRGFPGVKLDLWRAETDMETFFGLQQVFARWVRGYLAAVVAAGAMPARMTGLDARVMSALRELDRWPWDQPFREADLAAKVGLSAGHLDRLFVQGCGMRPRVYLQKRRLESAQAALADDRTTIKQTAYTLGFRSDAHFCRWFKRATGETPGRSRGARH